MSNSKTNWLAIPTHDGKLMDAYVALPPTGSGPAVVIIQEIFGVNEHIRAVADQYAADGFVAIAPDLFHRTQAHIELAYDQEGFQKGLDLLGGLNFDLAVADLASTVKAARGHSAVTGKVGSVGFCMGGLLSYLAAAKAGVDSAVCYYGGGIHTQLDLVKDIRVPILLQFAAKDGFIPPEAIAAVQTAFAGKAQAEVVVHPNVDHGFNCWRRPSWDAGTAVRARGLSLSHLGKTLF